MYSVMTFRLQGHVLPENKNIWVGLTMVFGIGRPKSKEILESLKIDIFKKVKDLSEADQKILTDLVKEMMVENDLRRDVSSNIKRLKEIKSYRWIRHSMWLPVRWQLTRKNAKTAKKLLWRAKVRPTIKK